MIYDVFIIYLLLVGFGGPLGIWLFIRWIKKVKRRKKVSVRALKRFESVKTNTPLDEPLSEAKEAALEAVESRFTIIKKTAVIFLILIWLVTLSFPFLNRIPATFISILIGSLGVIIGIASRPFIENMISGIVLSFSKTLKIGDTVIIDKMYGTVEDMTITHTVIKVWNWRRYLVPNSKMLTKDFINCTLNDNYQWAHVEFCIDYGSDIEKIKDIAIKSAEKCSCFKNYETPRFWVMDTEKDTIKCWVAAWADNAMSAWQLKHEIRTNLIIKFKELNIKTHRIIVETTQEISSYYK